MERRAQTFRAHVVAGRLLHLHPVNVQWHGAQQAAVRELREETGHAAARWTSLGDNNPNPAFMTNRCFVFLAEGCTHVGELQQDLGEDIEVVPVPMDEIDDHVRRGVIDHAIVLATIAMWRAHAAATE